MMHFTGEVVMLTVAESRARFYLFGESPREGLRQQIGGRHRSNRSVLAASDSAAISVVNG